MIPSLPCPPLQPLLFWQTGSLALVAGIVGARFPLVALTGFALLCLADSRSWKPACLALLLCCLGMGWWMGERVEPHRPTDVPAWLEESLATRKAVRVTGEVVRVDGLPNQRLRVRLHNVRPVAEDGSTPDAENAVLPGDMNWTWDKPPPATVLPRPLPGQHVIATLKIRPIRGFRNAGLRNAEDYWALKSIFFQSWSKEMTAEPVYSGTPTRPAALRERLRRAVTEALGLEAAPTEQSGQTGRGVIPALLFGDRFHLAYADVDRVKAAGLAHSLALSGQHLTVVGLGALALVAGLGCLFPGVFLHLPAFNVLALLSMPLAAGYLWLGDAPPSLVRSAIMLAVWCLFRGLSGGLFHRAFGGLFRSLLRGLFHWNGGRTGRRATGAGRLVRSAGLPLVSVLAFPDALLVALTCMVLFDPLCLYDIGVQLSFTAVAGIALASPLLHRLWCEGPLSFSPLRRLRNEISFAGAAGSRAVRFLWLTLGCSLAAQLATLPLSMEAFGCTTLWFPTNLIWLPVLGFVVLPLAFLGLIGVAAACPGLGGGLLELASLPCTGLFEGLLWLQREAGMAAIWGLRPHWTSCAGFGAVLVAVALLVGREKRPKAATRLLVAGVLLLVFGSALRFGDSFSQRVTLRILDVGQGQAIVLEWPRNGSDGSRFAASSALHRAFGPDRAFGPGNEALSLASSGLRTPEPVDRHDVNGVPGIARALIDGGGFFSEGFDSGRDIVSPILTANRQPRLDFIALSHPDRDHLRGLLFIAEQFLIDAAFTAPLPGIDEPLAPPKPLASALVAVLAQQAIPRHTLRAGDRFVLWTGDKGELTLDVLAPEPGEIPRDNNGLIFRLGYKGRGLALLPGDAEAPYVRALLRRGGALQADVLVVPHHGSAGSMVPALYRAVTPQLAVVSAGAFNSYRLPSWRVYEELEKQGIPLRVTADEGEIVCTWELE